ncbi:hypothetical protein P4797_21060 [Priestia aryabhattai]|uniref:hypothetical protein n=1 Tax=Priestia aryabhattai TaxID=412384 RepID=UPI002E1CB9F8|nr:hypothetical protein [Priestia aryabhattai]
MEMELNIQQRVGEYRVKSDQLFKQKNYQQSVDVLIKGWEEIPLPKGLYNDTYEVVKDIIDTFIIMNDYESAQYWLTHLYSSGFKRFDDGEKEFISGVIYYELGSLLLAKEFFDIANRKSEGRLFEGKDTKYIKLLKR